MDFTPLAEYIADTVGAMFSGNTETGIFASYQDTDNTIDLVVSNVLSTDEYNAVHGANTPSATNLFATVADVGGTASTQGAMIASATTKNPPVDADLLGFADSEASNILKKATFTQFKAFLKTYFDTLYCGISAIGARIAAADAKSPPVDADSIAICDSEDSNATKEVTFTALKSFLKTYFDSLYPAETVTTLGATVNGGSAKSTPINADMLAVVDTADSNKIKKTTLTEMKAFLKTYFDTVYGIAAVASFTPSLTWASGAPTVTAEVYKQKTYYDRTNWSIDIAGSNGDNATTCTVDFPAALIPTDINVKIPVRCQVSVNAGAFTNVVATLDCEAADGADRQLVITTGTLTTGQAFRIIASGEHQITPA
jgi:hypothetical protein